MNRTTIKAAGKNSAQRVAQKASRRFPIPVAQPHRDRKNDYRRRDKHHGTKELS